MHYLCIAISCADWLCIFYALATPVPFGCADCTAVDRYFLMATLLAVVFALVTKERIWSALHLFRINCAHFDVQLALQSAPCCYTPYSSQVRQLISTSAKQPYGFQDACNRRSSPVATVNFYGSNLGAPSYALGCNQERSVHCLCYPLIYLAP